MLRKRHRAYLFRHHLYLLAEEELITAGEEVKKGEIIMYLMIGKSISEVRLTVTE